MNRKTTWRRRVNRTIAPISAILGVVTIFFATIVLEKGLGMVCVVAAGVFCLEAGVWYMVNPVLTDERRYTGLRKALDHFIDLVRRLNQAVAGHEASQEVEALHTEITQAAEDICRLAGTPDAPAEPQTPAPEPALAKGDGQG